MSGLIVASPALAFELLMRLWASGYALDRVTDDVISLVAPWPS